MIQYCGVRPSYFIFHAQGSSGCAAGGARTNDTMPALALRNDWHKLTWSNSVTLARQRRPAPARLTSPSTPSKRIHRPCPQAAPVRHVTSHTPYVELHADGGVSLPKIRLVAPVARPWAGHTSPLHRYAPFLPSPRVAQLDQLETAHFANVKNRVRMTLRR